MKTRPTPPLRFVARPIPPVEELTPIERAQVVAAGVRYDGEELEPEQRLGESEEAGEEGEPWFEPSRFSVLDATGAEVFDLWLYNVDSGSMFHAGTDEVAADLIQFGFEYPDDLTIWKALSDAQKRAVKEDPESALGRYNFKLRGE